MNIVAAEVELAKKEEGERMAEMTGGKRRSFLKRAYLRFRHRRDGEISERTLRGMDDAIAHLRKGEVGPPIDPEELARLAAL